MRSVFDKSQAAPRRAASQARSRFSALACYWLALASTAAAAPITIPDQDTPVVDTAGVLDSATREKLIGWLHELKQKTHDQIKLLIVPTIGNENIFDFSQRHYDLWKLGEKGSDKGALIVLDLAEHKIRIHTGYGLEAALPDSFCGTLSRRIVKQYFARGQYSQGLVELTQAVVQRAAADAGVQIGELPALAPRDIGPADHQMDSSDVLLWVVVTIVILLILYSNWKNRGHRRRWAGTQPGWGWSTFPTGGWDSGGGSTGGGGWSSGGSDFGGGGSSGGGGGGASW